MLHYKLLSLGPAPFHPGIFFKPAAGFFLPENFFNKLIEMLVDLLSMQTITSLSELHCLYMHEPTLDAPYSCDSKLYYFYSATFVACNVDPTRLEVRPYLMHFTQRVLALLFSADAVHSDIFKETAIDALKLVSEFYSHDSDSLHPAYSRGFEQLNCFVQDQHFKQDSPYSQLGFISASAPDSFPSFLSSICETLAPNYVPTHTLSTNF